MMSIDTIFVAASGGSASVSAITLAAQLARRFEAHLEVFHAHADPKEAAMALGDGFAAPVAVDLIERATGEIAKAADRTKRQFEAAARQFELKIADVPPIFEPGKTRKPEATISWRDETGYAPELIARRARLFDLVILGRSERVVDRPHTDALEQTLLHCSQAILIAPEKTPQALGQCIAVAWNGSAEAARAVTGALPFLREAKRVAILTAGHVDGGEGETLSQSLAWRGIAAEVRHLPSAHGISVGKQLLTAARAEGADLLVMGGYGRAPWNEMLFGGATHQVLGSSLLPILIAH
jgi:nucleotide-binding universal stress UspA family protein